MGIQQPNSFANAIDNREARTANNMKARASSANACVDLFYKIGGMRGQDVIPAFVAAYVQNEDLSLRILQWARDVRGGAGERKLFRDALVHLANNYSGMAERLLPKIPELGRWDDLFCLLDTPLAEQATAMYIAALNDGHGLAAKWMKRKGPIAYHFQHAMGLTPKGFRKLIVGLTKVVETQMCTNDWDNINYAHVPSLAHARYKKAFGKHSPAYGEYLARLVKGEEKINAGAVYPYDIIKGWQMFKEPQWIAAEAQWNALENFVGDASVLSMVDVSESMTCAVGGSPNLRVIDVAMSLGLYTADKNTGKFKDCFVTFTNVPQIYNLKGSIGDKLKQMREQKAYNTNLHAAVDLILKTAIDGKVPEEEMPRTLLILSDMQFDECMKWDDDAYQMFTRKYNDAGYKLPNIVFWNLRDAGNVPVKFDKPGVALVSGFSPAIMKSILGGKEYTPESIMMEAVMIDRYTI